MEQPRWDPYGVLGLFPKYRATGKSGPGLVLPNSCRFGDALGLPRFPPLRLPRLFCWCLLSSPFLSENNRELLHLISCEIKIKLIFHNSKSLFSGHLGHLPCSYSELFMEQQGSQKRHLNLNLQEGTRGADSAVPIQCPFSTSLATLWAGRGFKEENLLFCCNVSELRTKSIITAPLQ